MSEAMVLNSTHIVLTWSPPGDAINPALLNYIILVKNGATTLAQLVTSVNETRAIVTSSLLSTCDTNLIIQPMCSTTAGRGNAGTCILEYMKVLTYIRLVFRSALVYH